MPFHSHYVDDNIHVPHFATYADEAARLAVVSDDIDPTHLFRLARQTSDQSYWTLESTFPTVTWRFAFGGGAGGGPSETLTQVLALGNVSGGNDLKMTPGDNVIIGGVGTPVASVNLDLLSTTGVLRLNRLTTIEKNAIPVPLEGMFLFDTDTKQAEQFDGFGWVGMAGGDVSGPPSSVDNTLARFNGTTGKVVQGSLVVLNDSGALSGLTLLNVDNIQLNGDTVSNTSSGTILIGAGGSRLGVGITGGTGNVDSIVHLREDSGGVGAAAGLTIENEGAGDALLHFLLTIFGATDWTMGLDNSDSDKFKIAVGNDLTTDTKFTIGTNGNIGIGIITPDSKLHVLNGSAGTVTAPANTITTFENSTTAIVAFLAPDASPSGFHFGHPSDNDDGGLFFNTTNASFGFDFRTGNVNRMVIKSDGKVGIGTNAPFGRLQIYDNNALVDGNIGLVVEQDGLGDALVQFLLSDTIRWIMGIDNSDSDKFKIAENTDLGSDTRLTIDTTGKIGMGTSSPLEHLHIQVNAAGGARFVLQDIFAPAYLRQVSTNGVNFIQSGLTSTTGSSAPLRFTNMNGSNTWMSILANGHVGIGSFTPVSTLHVYENNALVDSSVGLTIEQDGSGDAMLHFLLTGAARWVMGVDNSDGDKFKLALNTDLSNPFVTVNSLGDVGIGEINPDVRLHVDFGSSGIGSSPAGTVIRLESNGNAFLFLATPDASARGIYFGEPSNSIAGGIIYNSDIVDGFSFRTNGTGFKMALDSVGRLGIGTNAPDSLLHVLLASGGTITPGFGTVATLENNDDCFLSLLSIATEPRGIYFGDPVSNTKAEFTYHDRQDNAFQWGVNSLGPVMYLNNLGFLQVGHTEDLPIASTQLDVIAPAVSVEATAATLRMDNEFTTNWLSIGTAIALEFRLPSSDIVDTQAARIVAGKDTADWTLTASRDGNLQFWVTLNNTPSEAMRIDSTGSVGIGLTSPHPSSLLDVASTTAGFIMPRMTRTQLDAIASPETGLEGFNVSTNSPSFFDGNKWIALSTPSNVIRIASQADWDALVVTSTLTIASNTTLMVETTITTADEIVVNTGINFSIIGNRISTAGLIYTGAGTFITATAPGFLRIDGINNINGNATGTLFAITGSTVFVQLSNSGVFAWDDLGSVTTSAQFRIQAGLFNIGAGLVLTDVDRVFIDDMTIVNSSDMSEAWFQLSGTGDIEVSMRGVNVTLQPNEFLIDIDSGVTAGSRFSIANNILAGSNDTIFDPTGLDEEDKRVTADINSGDTNNSATSAEAIVTGNSIDTTIPAVNAWVLNNSTGWTGTDLNRISVITTGVFTYEGLERRTLAIDTSVNLEPVSATKQLSSTIYRILQAATVVTFTNATNVVNETATPRVNGDQVSFLDTAGTLPTGLFSNVAYFVVGQTTNTFQLSYTSGGSAITFSDDGSGTNSYKVIQQHGNIPVNSIAVNNPRDLYPTALTLMETNDKLALYVSNSDDAVDISVLSAYVRVIQK